MALTGDFWQARSPRWLQCSGRHINGFTQNPCKTAVFPVIPLLQKLKEYLVKTQAHENKNTPYEKISPNYKGVRIRTKRALALQVPACTSQCLILALTYSSHIFLRTNVLQWLEIFDFGMTKSGKIRHTDKDWWILRPMSVCVSVCF